MNRLIASILMVAVSCPPALAQDAATSPPVQAPSVDPERLALAQKILEEAHMRDTMRLTLDAFMPSMLASIRRQSPNLPEDTYKLISQMFSDEMQKELPQLVAVNAQLYASHFTLDELKAIDIFYQSAAGQKMVAETPKIIKEEAPLGMMWGRQAAQTAMERVIDKLRAQGVKI